jgi:signal recognition particle GTPase
VLLNPEVATMPTDLTLDEFMAQMNQVKRLGPSASLLKLIPGMRDMLEQAQLGESEIELALGRMRAMYDAMTLAERQAPSDIDQPHGVGLPRRPASTSPTSADSSATSNKAAT